MTDPNPQSDGQVTVVGICGSLRGDSYTRKVLEIALEGAAEIGASTQLIDLRDYDLGFCDGEESDANDGADAPRLRREVGAADGLILGTPEYHGSFSGVLKNAIDLMGFDEFEGKMIGLVGVSGGAMGALNALNGLRVVGRTLHAWVIPEQASIPHAYAAFDKEGAMKDAKLRKRISDIGRNVARFSRLHTSDHAQEFLRAWEGAPENPGAGDDED